MSAQMMTLNALATSAQYQEHAEFWTTTLRLLEDDFHLRQNWQSYALPYGPAPEHSCDIEGDAHATLTALSQGKDLNAFVILLAALFRVLRQYSGSNTVFVHTPPLADQGSSEPNACIPLVALEQSGASVRDYLNAIRATVQSSYSLQEFPIGALAEKLLKRLPLTNVLVRFEGLHAAPAPGAMEQYDLSILIRHRGRFKIELRGKPSAFTLHYLQHLARHWLNVVSQFRERQSTLDAVSLLDDAERSRLLAAPPTVPIERTVLDVFADHVRQSPSGIAVATSNAELSYADLDEQSTRLAHFLITEYGVTRGDTVGVLCDRSERWIIGLLGILKAGAIYVPLDPEFPAERIRYMIEDAGLRALLIDSEYMHLVTDSWTIPMFALDFQLATLDALLERAPIEVSPDDSAYIIYTSGSTGQPKGVVLQHRGLANMALYHIEDFGFEATDRFVQFYSPGFDGSIMEIFTTLCAGARLVLARADVIRNVAEFSELIARQEVTTLNAAPAYLSTLDWNVLGSIKRVISAGDNARVAEAKALSRTRAYHNSYGPTEATVCITDYVVDPDAAYGRRIPVGKPIRNARIYLLDEKLELVPEGCVGEICVSGLVLARGYLNRDELTAAAFVQHPFTPGERLYRTGDLGVWLPDGNLEIIGRRDGQVKVRGYRIELGEIEAALIQQAEVSEAVVLVREDAAASRKWLAAYVTAANDTISADLREHLKSRLPDFMVPQSITTLASMPRTANGKVDRKALAALAPEAEAPKNEYAAPTSDIEQRLGHIWSQVLGRERIGVHDNFFELGGDSILIIQIVSRAQQDGIKLTAQQHFTHPTLAALAKVAVKVHATHASQEIVTGSANLTPIQHWFFSQRVEQPQHYNQSFRVEVPSTLEAASISRALKEIVQHHDALRLFFFHAGESWEQVHAHTPLDVPVHTSELGDLPPLKQDEAMLTTASCLQESFVLSQAPLLRAHLFRFAPGQPSKLLLIAHHLVIDGVSWRILLEDLHSACRQIEASEPVRLPEKTASFQEWSRRLRDYSAGAIDGLPYWLEQAAASPTAFADLSRGTIASADSLVLRLDAETTRVLLQDVPRTLNAQIQEALLTALVLAFRDWTTDSALLIELEGHGRGEIFEDLDLSRTIGWFTSHYPVLLNVSGTSDATAALRTVQAQLQAVPKRGVTYGIARYLNKQSLLEQQPAPAVRFNYLGQIDRVLAEGADWKPLMGSNGPEHSASAARPHLFEIESVVFDACLTLTWTYNRDSFQRPEMERLLERHRAHLLSFKG